MTWRGSHYTEVTLDCFLPALCPFVSFSHLSTEVLVSATPHISQGILMKLSSYCFLDLKMIIFYWGHAQLIFIRVTVLWQIFNSKSSLQLLLQFSVDFSEILQLLSWSEEDRIIPRSHLTAFYKSYGPLSVLAIYQQFLFDIFQVLISIRIDTLWV